MSLGAEIFISIVSISSSTILEVIEERIKANFAASSLNFIAIKFRLRLNYIACMLIPSMKPENMLKGSAE